MTHSDQRNSPFPFNLEKSDDRGNSVEPIGRGFDTDWFYTSACRSTPFENTDGYGEFNSAHQHDAVMAHQW